MRKVCFVHQNSFFRILSKNNIFIIIPVLLSKHLSDALSFSSLGSSLGLPEKVKPELNCKREKEENKAEKEYSIYRIVSLDAHGDTHSLIQPIPNTHTEKGNINFDR